MWLLWLPYEGDGPILGGVEIFRVVLVYLLLVFAGKGLFKLEFTFVFRSFLQKNDRKLHLHALSICC